MASRRQPFPMRAVRTLLLCFMILMSSAIFAGPINILGCTWGADQFVMVGGGSTIITSSDAINWEHQEAGVSGRALEAVAWGNGKYIAVGDHNTIISSSDGRGWSLEQSPLRSDAHLYSVEWVHDRFIAVGSAREIISSKDGKTWQEQHSGTTETLRGVMWHKSDLDEGVYYIVGDNATFISSQDGTVWKSSDTGLRGDFKKIIKRRYDLMIIGNYSKGGLVVEPIIRRGAIDFYTGRGQFEKARYYLHGNDRRLTDAVWDGKETVAVGHDIAHYSAMRFVFLNASLDSIGPLQCVASNGERQVAGGLGGILFSLYSEHYSWNDKGAIWRGGAPIYSDETRKQFSLPMTILKTTPVYGYQKLIIKTQDFVKMHHVLYALLIYPLLQLLAYRRMGENSNWKILALLPLAIMVLVYPVTIYALINRVGLLSGFMMVTAPYIIGYLLVIIAIRETYRLREHLNK